MVSMSCYAHSLTFLGNQLICAMRCENLLFFHRPLSRNVRNFPKSKFLKKSRFMTNVHGGRGGLHSVMQCT